MKRNLICIFLIIVLVSSLLLFLFNLLEDILYFPIITPIEWCESQPCIEITPNLILVQPTSTLFVYLLGILVIIIGINLLDLQQTKKLIIWWAIALILWGIGAILAGTSYQAFSFEIKCRGRSSCIWTSLWEIYYLIFSVGSVNVMLVAQSRLNEGSKSLRFMEGYAYGNFLVYIIIIVIGSLVPVQFLISFELMIFLLAPTILFLLIFNIKQYYRNKLRINHSLIVIWSVLIIIIGIYFLYYLLGITETLWEQGFWFSENDFLHIGLMIWMVYIWHTMRTYQKFSS